MMWLVLLGLAGFALANSQGSEREPPRMMGIAAGAGGDDEPPPTVGGIVVTGCEAPPPKGAARWKRSQLSNADKAEVDQYQLGSEPFAVNTERPASGSGELREQGASASGLRSFKGATPEGSITLSFRPPGHWSERMPTGYVLARSRRNFSLADAIREVDVVDLGNIGGTIERGKAALALAKNGSTTTSWLVAVWNPESCDYDVWTLDADPARDAILGRL